MLPNLKGGFTRAWIYNRTKGAGGKGGGGWGTTQDGEGGGLMAKEVTRTHPKSIILHFVFLSLEKKLYWRFMLSNGGF